ncbi:myosin protein XIG [Trifolium repens]|nr:myosin protein XIG [Trifolium repens]
MKLLLFDWLVDKINNSIGQDPDSKSLISVLDIYVLRVSRLTGALLLHIFFEQFCINLTNEKLQQHFNQHVFKMEQEEYKKEEIDWSYIEFVDNQNILDLIEKIGKTKVFLRAGQMEELDTYRSEILGKSASIIQRKVRSYLARRSFVSIRLSAIQIHFKSHCRKYLVQHHFKNLKKAAISTQCACRGKVARQELRNLKMAARETGALRAAKNKLVKQVEDLTLRLQLEKRMRADMEEARQQENEKLQSALQEMQLQFKETKSLLQKELGAAKREAERVPVVQEVPVVDHPLMEKLTSEN